eukprot:CAMPEP_0182442532 /NCGR_PEP_ID=MMETSP1172-20130603/1446_1 /TAXON_ID=708627 /ORGANISM="Timspurckia oligopyrenoides, Strain CCMP3278" /LENGTH=153 /DNA_ID=CAMNT_0024637447 /DNA_START=251 /DNA_END=712 /DNA_ORIENTATION=-
MAFVNVGCGLSGKANVKSACTCGQRMTLSMTAGDQGSFDGNAFSGNLDLLRANLERQLQIQVEDLPESTCLWCEGSGRCRCPWCNGEGHRMEMEMKSSAGFQEDIEKMMKGEPVKLPGKVPVRCSACTGTKKLRCRYCRGSGKGIYGNNASLP